MERISFLNGKFLPHDQAFIHIDDRATQFGDGVYEVILFHNNRLIDFDEHLQRLFRSLAAIELKFDRTQEKLKQEFKEIFLKLFQENNLPNGYVYLQITRGVAARTQIFPTNCTPTIIATVAPNKIIAQKDLDDGLFAVTSADIRWGRCDIKSTALLANILVKQKANEIGAAEVILIRDDYVTEGSFSNIFIVDKNNILLTHHLDNNILGGVTRARVIALANGNNIKIVEKKFSKQELFAAREAFATSSTLLIRPISKIDQQIIGDGKAGVITKKLIKLYNDYLA